MSNLLPWITQSRDEGKSLFAVLIDPDKTTPNQIPDILQRITAQNTWHPAPDLLFVGGSIVAPGITEPVVQAIKQHSALPVVLFPGDGTQLTPAADALLHLSLASGNNAEYLIGQQRRWALQIHESGLECIPTGYLLIDGGQETAVVRVTGTSALSQKDLQTITASALAAQHNGAQLIYLEAGSGAKVPVSPEVIRHVQDYISVPLIVGGGIRTRHALDDAYAAGADMVVVGTALESL